MRYVENMIAGGFVMILALCNMHLFTADSAATLCFKTEAFLNGEWWRIITHPFVHVSWYHLMLDAAAVAILWHGINLPSRFQKLFGAWCCGVGSLVTAIWLSPLVDRYGLCGLSGTAHGMMFFLGLHLMNAPGNSANVRIRRTAGGALVCASGLKSLIEMTTGQVIFTSMHAGDLGIPIVESHLGGIVGGLAAFMLITLVRARRITTVSQTRSENILNRDANLKRRSILF